VVYLVLGDMEGTVIRLVLLSALAGCSSAALPVPQELCNVALDDPGVFGGASDARDCYWGSVSALNPIQATTQLRDGVNITQVSMSMWNDPVVKVGESVRLTGSGGLIYNVRDQNDPNAAPSIACDQFYGTLKLVALEPWRMEVDAVGCGVTVRGAMFQGR
jgi:hypothetical protein